MACVVGQVLLPEEALPDDMGILSLMLCMVTNRSLTFKVSGLSGRTLHMIFGVVTKERKGEATVWKRETAHTHTNPMQPASHQCYHPRSASLLRSAEVRGRHVCTADFCAPFEGSEGGAACWTVPRTMLVVASACGAWKGERHQQAPSSPPIL